MCNLTSLHFTYINLEVVRGERDNGLAITSDALSHGRRFMRDITQPRFREQCRIMSVPSVR